MIANIGIEVINENCLQCPDLEADTTTKVNTVVDDVKENGDIQSHTECENVLRCVHYFECKNRLKALKVICYQGADVPITEKNFEKPAPKKKSAARRKTKEAEK